MNPFGPSYPAPHLVGDPAYRDFFVAKLTGKATVAGVNYYAWTEQTIDTDTGLPTDANPAREGTTTSSPAIEVNNADLDVTADLYVFIRQKGFFGGAICYEFEYARQYADILARVDSVSGLVHTCRRLTRSVTNEVEEYVPATDYAQVLYPPGVLAVGTLVELYEIIDHPGWWWAMPYLERGSSGGGGSGSGGSGSGSGSGSGGGTPAPPGSSPGTQRVECVEGTLYQTRGYQSAAVTGGQIESSWWQLYTTAAGCCECAGTSGSGSGSGSGARAGTCCPDGADESVPFVATGPWAAVCGSETLTGTLTYSGGTYQGTISGATATGSAKLQCVGGSWEITIVVTPPAGDPVMVSIALASSGAGTLTGTGISTSLNYGLCQEGLLTATVSVGHPCEDVPPAGPVDTSCCAETPATLYLHTTDCGTCGETTFPLVYAASGSDGAGWYSEVYDCGGRSLQWVFYCDSPGGDLWTLVYYCDGNRATQTFSGTCGFSGAGLSIAVPTDNQCCALPTLGSITDAA